MIITINIKAHQSKSKSVLHVNTGDVIHILTDVSIILDTLSNWFKSELSNRKINFSLDVDKDLHVIDIDVHEGINHTSLVLDIKKAAEKVVDFFNSQIKGRQIEPVTFKKALLDRLRKMLRDRLDDAIKTTLYTFGLKDKHDNAVYFADRNSVVNSWIDLHQCLLRDKCNFDCRINDVLAIQSKVMDNSAWAKASDDEYKFRSTMSDIKKRIDSYRTILSKSRFKMLAHVVTADDDSGNKYQLMIMELSDLLDVFKENIKDDIFIDSGIPFGETLTKLHSVITDLLATVNDKKKTLMTLAEVDLVMTTWIQYLKVVKSTYGNRLRNGVGKLPKDLLDQSIVNKEENILKIRDLIKQMSKGL